MKIWKIWMIVGIVELIVYIISKHMFSDRYHVGLLVAVFGMATFQILMEKREEQKKSPD